LAVCFYIFFVFEFTVTHALECQSGQTEYQGSCVDEITVTARVAPAAPEALPPGPPAAAAAQAPVEPSDDNCGVSALDDTFNFDKWAEFINSNEKACTNFCSKSFSIINNNVNFFRKTHSSNDNLIQAATVSLIAEDGPKSGGLLGKLNPKSAHDKAKLGRDLSSKVLTSSATAFESIKIGYDNGDACTCTTKDTNQQAEAQKIQEACYNGYKYMLTTLQSDIKQAATAAADFTRAQKQLIGGISAVVGGAIVVNKIKDDKDDKKEKRRAAQEKKDFEAGIIKDASGNKIECYSPDNYMRNECKAAVQRVCSGEKRNEQGCVQFSNAFCGNGLGEGANTNFCMAREAAKYCAVPTPESMQAPSCMWHSNIPLDCKGDPNSRSCGVTLTEAQLSELCARFTSDPVCKRYAAGTLILGTTRSIASRSNPQTPPSWGSSGLFESNTEATRNLCRQGFLVNCP
jgi:hypothetical protein